MAFKKSDFKMRIREEAHRKVKPQGGAKGQAGFRDAVERGRRELLLKGDEGGDSKAQRIKGELLYLINNYVPANDARIETLIDQWRTSGDPSYSTDIRAKFLRARRDYSKKSDAL
ncbi:MAG: hypothetical protein AMXMBFR84_16520 [Candidatus Hydrogenedentota bacterium]